MVRFTRSNWDRFETHNKQTTIRTHPLKSGSQKAYGGSRYKPELLGYVWIAPYLKPFPTTVRDLTEKDAVADGFGPGLLGRDEALRELLIELAHRNPNLTLNTPIYVHPARKLSEQEYLDLRHHVPNKVTRRILGEVYANPSSKP